MEALREAALCYMNSASEEYVEKACRALDSGESIEDFYIRETKRGIRRCDVCVKLLLDFYFICTKCEICPDHNYNLCVECFYGGTFEHGHDSFADNHSVLMMLGQNLYKPSCVIEQKAKGKCLLQQPRVQVQQTTTLYPAPVPNLIDSSPFKSITPVPSLRDSSHFKWFSSRVKRKITVDKEGLQKLAFIAEAHNNAAPQRIRASADEFFWSMVKKRGKTSVTMEDFLKSMKEMRYPEYASPELFQMLVKDRNLGMTLPESRTVYYILLSGRPFCSWCKCFIPDIYFCCSKCSARSYALCLPCYANKAYVNHNHYGDNDVFFLDYTVLHSTIKTSSAASNQEQTGSSNAIVKMNHQVGATWTVLYAILNAGTTAISIASVFGACTIL